MTELADRPSVQVTFPEGAQYGNALYHLRKALKASLVVEIHKRPGGVSIVCSKDQLASLIVALGTLEGYSITQVLE